MLPLYSGLHMSIHWGLAWHHRTCSTLVQVMTCCLATPSHYLNQVWLNHWWSLVAFTWRQFHMKCSRYLSLIQLVANLLTHKQLGTHGCVLSTVATDALVLCTKSSMSTVLTEYSNCIELNLYRNITVIWNNIWKWNYISQKLPSCLRVYRKWKHMHYGCSTNMDLFRVHS